MENLALFAFLVLAMDITPLMRIGVIITALIPIAVLFGALYFTWDSIKAFFGRIPLIGDVLK